MSRAYHAHLDSCRRCAERPWDLCPVGARVLWESATGTPPGEYSEIDGLRRRPVGYRDETAADHVDPLVVDDHCEECGESTPECVCDDGEPHRRNAPIRRAGTPGLSERDLAEIREYAEEHPMVQLSCHACSAPISAFTRRPDSVPDSEMPPLLCCACGGTIPRWEDWEDSPEER